MFFTNITSYNDLTSLNAILNLSLVGFLNTFVTLILSYRFFQAIQQCGYRGADYYKFVFIKDNAKIKRLFNLTLLSILGFLLTNMAFAFLRAPYVSFFGFVWYLFFIVIYQIGESKKPNKVPLVKTKRMIRLMITFSVLTLLFNLAFSYLANLICILTQNELFSLFRYSILCVMPLLVPYLILLAYVINNPFEKLVNKHYLKLAKQTIKKFKGKKIAITGSFAKTSVKEILTTILSEKYNVLKTPLSYNTPLGIAKTVKRLNNDYNVFISELGARRVGDINKLTNLIEPDIAVITGVTSQHLETFLTINNIKKAKYELIENMKGGFAVFSNDNEYSVEMYNDCPFDKYLAGINSKNASVYATDIEYTFENTTFTLNYKDQSVKITTSLVGESAVTNICLASAVSLNLGLTLPQIAVGINKIESVKHRLEIIKNQVGAYIIDDSYNSNPEGVKKAVALLNIAKGKKYVVTPGMIELGVFEHNANFDFGVQLAKVCDKVLLIKRGGTLNIRQGLLSQGFDKNNIIMIESLEEGKKFLAENLTCDDAVLFENDLPDIYTE